MAPTRSQRYGTRGNKHKGTSQVPLTQDTDGETAEHEEEEVDMNIEQPTSGAINFDSVSSFT